MSHVFLRKATKIIPLLAALTGGALELHAMKTGQGDVSPNRNIGAIPGKDVFKKRLGFQAFLAQSGKAIARNVVQLVVRAHPIDRKLARFPQKKGSFVLKSTLRSIAVLRCLPDACHGSIPGFADRLDFLEVSGGSAFAEACSAAITLSLDKAAMRMLRHSARPEVYPMASLGEDVRKLRRILDLFRPALFAGLIRHAAMSPGEGLLPLDTGAPEIHFTIDLPSAGAPLTHGRLGAHIALRSNRSRDNWS